MIRENRHVFYFVFIALFCGLLIACSKIFVIKPSGSISGHVRFDFFESETAGKSSSFMIVEFVVQKQTDTGRWVTSWELVGKQALSSIEYGSEYDGLVEVVPPAPLEKNTNYRVLASELSATGPKGYAGSEFHFIDSGEMVVKEGVQNTVSVI